MPVYPGAPESAPEPLNVKDDTPEGRGQDMKPQPLREARLERHPTCAESVHWVTLSLTRAPGSGCLGVLDEQPPGAICRRVEPPHGESSRKLIVIADSTQHTSHRCGRLGIRPCRLRCEVCCWAGRRGSRVSGS